MCHVNLRVCRCHMRERSLWQYVQQRDVSGQWCCPVSQLPRRLRQRVQDLLRHHCRASRKANPVEIHHFQFGGWQSQFFCKVNSVCFYWNAKPKMIAPPPLSPLTYIIFIFIFILSGMIALLVVYFHSGLRQNHDLFEQCNRKYNSCSSHHINQHHVHPVFYLCQY